MPHVLRHSAYTFVTRGGRGHQGLFRQCGPWLDDEVSGTRDSGREPAEVHQKVSESGNNGSGSDYGDRGWGTAGWSVQSGNGECVPALRDRQVVRCAGVKGVQRRMLDGALRRRCCILFPIRERCEGVLRQAERAAGEIRAGAVGGKEQGNQIRAVCGQGGRAIRLSGVHHSWGKNKEREIHGQVSHEQKEAQVQEGKSEEVDKSQYAHPDKGTDKQTECEATRSLQLLRAVAQCKENADVLRIHQIYLVQDTKKAKSEEEIELGWVQQNIGI